MQTSDQYRASAVAFTHCALRPLCAELVEWSDSGTLGQAPFFKKLIEICNLYVGLTNGRKVAENLVRTEAMRFISTNPV